MDVFGICSGETAKTKRGMMPTRASTAILTLPVSRTDAAGSDSAGAKNTAKSSLPVPGSITWQAALKEGWTPGTASAAASISCEA